MRNVISLVLALGVSLSAGSPAPAPLPDPGETGPYLIGHTSFLLVDQSRNGDSPWSGRPIPVNVWYPADAEAISSAGSLPATYPLDAFESDPSRPGWPVSTSPDWEQFGLPAAYENVAPSPDKPFPLVVVSPGWGTRYYQLLFYVERLASHGFVVAVAEHYLDGAYGFEPWDMNLGVALWHRPADISFMLDEMLARNTEPSDVLFGSIRPDLIAATGHSLGGYAAMALAGGDDEVCASLADPLPVSCSPSLGTTVADARIKAIVPLDGSNQVLHFTELARIRVPAMSIGQAVETVADWQARQHVAISGKPSYRADVLNSRHGSFVNNCTTVKVLYGHGLVSEAQMNTILGNVVCSVALDQREVNRLAAKYAVAFLKTHLAGAKSPSYQRVLTPGWALTLEENIEFFVTEPANAAALGEDPIDFLYFLHQPGSLVGRALCDPRDRKIEMLQDR